MYSSKMAASAFIIIYFLNIEVALSQFSQAGENCLPIPETFRTKGLESLTDPEDCNKYITCPPPQECRNFYASFLHVLVAMFLGVIHDKEESITVDTILRPSNRSIKQAAETICQMEGHPLPLEKDCRKYIGASKYAYCGTNGEDTRYPHEDCAKFFTCEKNMEETTRPGAVWEYKGTDPYITDRIQINIGICSTKTKQCLLYLNRQWSIVKSDDCEILPSASTGLYVSGSSRNTPKLNPEMVCVYRTMDYKFLQSPGHFSLNNKIRSTNLKRSLHII